MVFTEVEIRILRADSLLALNIVFGKKCSCEYVLIEHTE